MYTLRKTLTLFSGLAVASVCLAATDAASAGHSLAPYFTPAAPGATAPDEDGFIRRWLLLEPINKALRTNAGFVDSFVRQEITRDYFPNQFTMIPRDSEKVTVEDEELTWHAVDATGFNVKLFRFASNLDKRVYGVLFWAVTVIDCPHEIENVRLAVGSNSASMWWLNGEEAVTLFGDRRMVMDDRVSKRVTLRQGQNVIRGAVINGPGMSDFCARLIDENGDPITGYTITLQAAGQ